MIAELIQGLKDEIVRMRQTPLVVGNAKSSNCGTSGHAAICSEEAIDQLSYSDLSHPGWTRRVI